MQAADDVQQVTNRFVGVANLESADIDAVRAGYERVIRPRLADARFFLMPAEALAGDPDDFSAAEDELGHLHWVPLAEARDLDLPFVTEVALAEVAAIVAGAEQPGVPFFDNSGAGSVFERL